MAEKEYLADRIKAVVTTAVRAKNLVDKLHRRELERLTDNRAILLRNQDFVKEIEKLASEFLSIRKEAVMLEKQAARKAMGAVRPACEHLQEHLLGLKTKLKHLMSEEHYLEENRARQVKEIKREFTKLEKLRDLINELDDLRKKLTAMIGKKSLIIKEKPKRIKL